MAFGKADLPTLDAVNRGQGENVALPLVSLVAGWSWSLAVAAMLVLGGTNPSFMTLRGLAETIGVVLLGVTLGSRHSHFRRPRTMDWLILAAMLLWLLQLVPLPPALWQTLPLREIAADIDHAVFGAPRWRPVALDVEATIRAFLFLVPALAAYLAIRTGPPPRRRAILRGVAIALAIALLLGLAQAANQPWSRLLTGPVSQFVSGFFTNHNHHASFLLAGFLLVIPYFASHKGSGGPRSESGWTGWRSILFWISLVLVAIGVLLTGSRTGLMLLGLIMVLALGTTLSGLLAKRDSEEEGNGRRRPGLAAGLFLAGLIGMATVLVLPFTGDSSLSSAAERSALEEDRRYDIWPHALELAVQAQPAGTGFGSFRRVYEQHEPLDSLGTLYINHAHNDYIELAIEGGVPALLLATIFLVWFLKKLFDLLRRRLPEPLLSACAGGVILTMLLHSLVDYPLRTITISSIYAIALGLLVVANPDRRRLLAT
jgi:O-antigen ligase